MTRITRIMVQDPPDHFLRHVTVDQSGAECVTPLVGASDGPVIRVALGRERLENRGSSRCARTTAMTRSSPIPGIEGAHEKGGVEGEIGRFRRRHLTPVPHVGSLAAFNHALAAADAVTTPAASVPALKRSAPRRLVNCPCCVRCPRSPSTPR